MTSVFEELELECCAAMLHDNVDLSRLMFYSQQVEESWLRNKNRHVKKATSFESCSSKGGLDIEDKPSFKNRFSNKVSYDFPKS